MRAVQEFERAGIAAIHIEDQVFPKRASYHRGLEHVVELDEFSGGWNMPSKPDATKTS